MGKTIELLKDFVRDVAPLNLCLVGGISTWGGFELFAEGHPELGWMLFLAASLMWSFALDLVKQKAEARGLERGALKMLEALSTCESIDVHIHDHSKAK